VGTALEREEADEVSSVNNLDRITFDPEIMGGRACIRGTRVTVALLLNLVANGMSVADIAAEYPYIEEEDVRQALRYAAWLAEERVHSVEMPAA
jgi:uncharacterized protein (DUF433 family)